MTGGQQLARNPDRMPLIVICDSDGSRRELSLGPTRITIGRSGSADLSFPNDGGLSRVHAAFERRGEHFVICDLNSKNGTTVNGERVDGEQRLRPNDQVKCGHLKIEFDPGPASGSGVVFVEETTERMSNAAIMTSLGGVLEEARTGAGVQVSALIQAGNELAGERPLSELFPIILDLAMRAVGALRGLLMTIEQGQLIERANRGDQFKISTAIRDRVLEQKLSVLVRDTSLDDALRARQSIVMARVTTLMAAPLQVRDEVKGILYVDSPRLKREFTKNDLSLLTVMANVAAIRIEHARLAHMEQARKLMERELEQAEAIQRNALPAHAPLVPKLDLAGRNAASRTISGDYYDFFTDGAGRVAMTVADVSGKGLPAALMVMALQARVQPLFETLPSGPAALQDAMVRLNRLTAANCPPARFITMFACVVDGDSGRVDWVSAGHNPPLIVRADGSFELLEGVDPILGIFRDLAFKQMQARLGKGDLLAIYSDGISEACSPEGEEFETERLADVLRANRNNSAEEIADAVLNALREWTCDAPAADDITLVIARKTEL